METSGKILNSPGTFFFMPNGSSVRVLESSRDFRNWLNIPEYMVLVYIWHMISKVFPDFSGAFLKSIYKSSFHKGIFGVISPFNCQNLMCWNSDLLYQD